MPTTSRPKATDYRHKSRSPRKKEHEFGVPPVPLDPHPSLLTLGIPETASPERDDQETTLCRSVLSQGD